MIVTKGLTQIYKSFRGGQVLAVDHIDFTVPPGDIFGFLGPNGAGKTTTIHMLTTVLTPSEGTADICGHDILKAPLLAKRKLGFMPEMPAFYEWMKAEDQLRFYCKFYGYSTSESQKRAKELMELVGLSAFTNRKIKTFSHGMRKRLALAQALVNDPELLILDEPMGGLDPMGLSAFREMIKELHKHDITIFLSSHLLTEVQQLCNRIGIIHNGKILVEDTISNLSKHIAVDTMSKLHIEGPGLSNKILDYIKTLSGVLDVKPGTASEGGYLVSIEEDMDATVLAGELNRSLAEKNIYLTRLEQTQPSLEDLFMKITRGN